MTDAMIDRMIFGLVIFTFAGAVLIAVTSIIFQRTCRFCRNRIHRDATTCPHCTKELTGKDKLR